jgi:hypothetical protein
LRSPFSKWSDKFREPEPDHPLVKKKLLGNKSPERVATRWGTKPSTEDERQGRKPVSGLRKTLWDAATAWCCIEPSDQKFVASFDAKYQPEEA